MTTIPDRRVQEVANQLMGTCNSLSVYLDDGDNELDFVDALLSHVFLCDGCQWWCSVDELHNIDYDELCDDCNTEQQREDTGQR